MTIPFLLRCKRSRRRDAATLAFALWFLAAPAWSAAAEISFDEAVRLAMARAPSLQALRSQTVAAREEATRAAALPDPTLTFGLINLPVTGGDAFDGRADDMTMKEIGVMQALPAPAKRRSRQAVADRGIEQAEALSTAGRLAVHRAAAEAWIALWAAQREVDALRELREPSALAIRVAEARLASGIGSAADALATQAAALELENRIDAAEAAVGAARGTLARWLGETSGDLVTVGAPPDLTVLPVGEATLLASVDRHAALLPWRSRETVAEAEVARASAETRPDWSIGVSYGQRNRSRDGVPRSDMLSIEVSVDLPLFTRNRQDRGIAARRAELDAVAAAHEDARLAQRETVRRALARWHGLKRQVTRKEVQMLPLAHDRARVAMASYGGGGELQPWLEARRDELELHVEHARHLGELGREWAALAFLMPDEETTP